MVIDPWRTYPTILPSMKSRASKMIGSEGLPRSWMYRLTSGFCHEWIEMRKGAPAGKLGTKDVTVGSNSWLSCEVCVSIFSQLDRCSWTLRCCSMPTGILNDLTSCLEFLQWDLALVWENQDIPVLITHSGNFKLARELYLYWFWGASLLQKRRFTSARWSQSVIRRGWCGL